MDFEPFPPGLLAAIATLPDPIDYGLESLPFLRWLGGHTGARTGVMIEDGRGLAAPVLAQALPQGGFRRLRDGDKLPNGVDLVHVAADLPGDRMATVLRQARASLRPGGVLVVTVPGHATMAGADAVNVPIGDGLSLQAAGPASPVLSWLVQRTPAELAEFVTLFNVLGRQIAAAAELQGRATRQQQRVERDRRATLRLEHQLRAARRTEAALLGELARETATREAIVQSTSWKLTGPLRTAIMASSGRRPKRVPPVVEAQTPEQRHEAKVKADFKRHAAAELWDFLVSGERLQLPASAAPDISILLVLFNQAPMTLMCLRSIVGTVPLGAAVEVVIVDNASSDDTALLLERVDGARVVRNAGNRHFLHGLNQAAALATGHDLLLLNNDAQLRPGAVQAAHRTLHSAPDIGAVGGKIILLDDTLQEAGSIVWADGTCVGHGRGEDPVDPAFQFRRTVDFCSGAFLMVRTALFRALGGLDTAFAPAYYEEVDLCMRLRDAGHRIVYEPQAELVHYEFGSSASSDAAIALQRDHHALFAARHAARLQSHLPPGSPQLATRMDRGQRRMLFIDDRVPYPELGAGYPRAARLLHELVALGWFITFYPAHLPDDDWGSVRAAFPAEIEFMVGYGAAELEAFLHGRDGYYDTILVSRPHNMRSFLRARGATHARARLIYDAEAVFATREFLQLQHKGTPASAELRRSLLQEEIGLTATAAMVTTVNQREADIFRGGGHPDVRVLGLGVEPQPVSAGFAGRRDFLFVGVLDYDETPNADAVIWFAERVMPLLEARLGPVRLLVAGRCVAPRVLSLASDRVLILGLVDDLTPIYAAARVFVAPHRYAAGLPLKVQEAAGRGLPVVASALLARQLGWTDGQELLVATTADEFAAACARLYSDAALWHALRRQGLDRLTAEARGDDFTTQVTAILGSGVASAEYALRLEPAHDVAPDGPDWRGTGSDPYFLLRPDCGFPVGRCEFAFEALPGTTPLQPVLYLDTGADFSEAQSIRMAGGLAGTYRQIVELPAGLKRLRFDPTGLPGPLPLRRVRLVPRQGPLRPAHAAKDDYGAWLALYGTLSGQDLQEIARHVRSLPPRPFAVSIEGDDPAKLRLTTDSLDQQLYPHWRLDGPGEAGVLMLQAGDVLAPHALYRMALALAEHPDAAALTLDEDRLDPATGVRSDPVFRAAWSSDLVRSGDLGPLLLRQPAAPAAVRDLLLGLPRTAIRHVPGVLVSRTGRIAEAGPYAANGRLSSTPLVSVIIPTRDHVAILRGTVQGLLERTDYPPLELIILDNGSVEPATHAYFAELALRARVRVLPAPGPFNYSQLNNAGVAAAQGEVVALLNNDIDVINGGWLTAMVAHALRPEVGAVGGKLLYADGTIQHAGIVTGLMGIAGHPFRGTAGDAPGYLGLLSRTRAVSAVTGACLVMRRALYQEVGGLDAAELAVSYSDVDLCLKLGQVGYEIIWTPDAVLYHLESATRGADARPDNAARAQREHDVMLRRWGELLLRDPYYSPCLTLDDEGYGLAWPPRVPQPWRDFSP